MPGHKHIDRHPSMCKLTTLFSRYLVGRFPADIIKISTNKIAVLNQDERGDVHHL